MAMLVYQRVIFDEITQFRGRRDNDDAARIWAK